MRVSVSKTFSFEASHCLPNHPGKCARNHGHSYNLEVTIVGDIQNEGSSEGMILDFGDLTKIVNEQVVDQWDHQFLNDLVPFPTTAENLAVEIFRRLTVAGLQISRVRLWETKKCSAIVEV